MAESAVKKAQQDMTELAGLTDQTVEAIRGRLAAMPIQDISEESLKSEFELVLPSAANRSIIAERLSDVLWNICRLSVVSDDDVSSVISGLGTWVCDEGGLSADVWRAAEKKLLFLSDTPSLYVAVKAAELRSAVGKELSSVKLITDLRPVFTRQISDGPAGFVLMHTLQLLLSDVQGGEELYFGITDNILDDLAAQVDRAMTKRQALRNSLPKELVLLT